MPRQKINREGCTAMRSQNRGLVSFLGQIWSARTGRDQEPGRRKHDKEERGGRGGTNLPSAARPAPQARPTIAVKERLREAMYAVAGCVRELAVGQHPHS